MFFAGREWLSTPRPSVRASARASALASVHGSLAGGAELGECKGLEALAWLALGLAVKPLLMTLSSSHSRDAKRDRSQKAGISDCGKGLVHLVPSADTRT